MGKEQEHIGRNQNFRFDLLVFSNMKSNSPEIERERYKLLQQVENWLEIPTFFLGMVWLALLIVEFTRSLSPFLNFIFYLIWGVFIFEFMLRFFLAPHKITFLKKNVITLLALFVPALRVFRVFQALRILRVARAVRGIRLFRVLSSLNRGFKSLRKVFSRKGFGYVVTFTIIVTLASSAAMYAFESDTNGFQTFGDSLWWTAMMMTTSGSGYWPVSPEGRILAFLLALYAFAIFGYVAATLASFFIEREADSDDSEVVGQRQIKKLIEEIQLLKNELKKQ
jgi:voltage-gated potassium channel